MAAGKVVQIIGPVIDCEFAYGQTPKINEGIRIIASSDGIAGDDDVYAEVLQQRGKGVVRCVAFNATEGLTRGLKAVSEGSSFKVPVGEGVMGRLFDVLGRPIDNGGPIEAEAYLPIRSSIRRRRCSRPVSR